MLIAIPSDAPGGLDANISAHFGHCDAFTLVKVDDGKLGDVEIHKNQGHEQGGCMAPVMTLKQLGVDVLIAGGMGMRPLAGFQQVGIAVHHMKDSSTVRDAAELFVSGGCPEFGQAQTCGGGGGGCGSDDHGHEHHHHHEPVEREPIEGKADVQDGRVVTMHFTLKDVDGNVLDASSPQEPMQYLQGSGAIPGLEKGLAGLEAGEKKEVVVSAEDGFGERDESRILEVPRTQLPPNIAIGMVLAAQDPSGHQMQLVVKEIKDDVALLDANHPLAGKELHFDVTVEKVEQATAEEIQHGHVH